MKKHRLPVEDQLLFLVADVNNKLNTNAVMLHDGIRKLGYVVATQAPEIRALLDKLSLEMGQDFVIVVSFNFPAMTGGYDPKTFEQSSSINVSGVGMVYERLARKYAQEAEKIGSRSTFNN